MKMTREHKVYLDALRKSGATNMYGAGAYLEDTFDLDRREARAILMEWMETFTQENDTAREETIS